MAVTRKTNLKLFQGETFRFRFKYVDSNMNPIDLTNCTAHMQVRPDVDSDVVLMELSTSNGRIFINGALGLVDLYIPPDDVEYSDIPWEEGVYDLEVTYPNGDKDKVGYGKIKVVREVTR